MRPRVDRAPNIVAGGPLVTLAPSAFRRPAATYRERAIFRMLSHIDRQILRSWREYLIEPALAKLTGRVLRRTGPRIAVLGNCQAYGIAYALKLLDPTATVDHFSAIGRNYSDIGLLARTLATYDHVLAHEFPPGHVRNGGSDVLAELLPKAVFFPAITFAAFHPDLIYLLDATRGNAQLTRPVGPYHSALAVFAHRRGLSVEDSRGLFATNVFDALGYCDMWNDSVRELLDFCGRYGFDLSGDIMNWSRRGVFMYSTVHPKAFVLCDLAKRLAERVGLPLRNLDFDLYSIHDLARSEIFPVYPGIAERYGAKGSYLFKLQNHHLSAGTGDFMTLPQYLEACWRVYDQSRPEQMSHPRIERWLADDKVSAWLVAAARENRSKGLQPVL